MRTLVILSISLLYLFFTTRCKEPVKKIELINIYSDQFPILKIDTAIMDTIGFKNFITQKLNESIYDSIIFIIECPENIVIENILNTQMMLKNQMSQANNNKASIRISYECIANLTPPNKRPKRVIQELVIQIDKKGNLFLNDSAISMDTICRRFKGKNLPIKLIPDNSLPLEQFVTIMENLNKEGFTVNIR